MPGVIRAEDFLLESHCPPGGAVLLRLTHLPTGLRWSARGQIGQTREAAQEELFQQARRDLIAAGWVPAAGEECGPSANGRSDSREQP
jgi:hypothetical protein